MTVLWVEEEFIKKKKLQTQNWITDWTVGAFLEDISTLV